MFFAAVRDFFALIVIFSSLCVVRLMRMPRPCFFLAELLLPMQEAQLYIQSGTNLVRKRFFKESINMETVFLQIAHIQTHTLPQINTSFQYKLRKMEIGVLILFVCLLFKYNERNVIVESVKWEVTCFREKSQS